MALNITGVRFGFRGPTNNPTEATRPGIVVEITNGGVSLLARFISTNNVGASASSPTVAVAFGKHDYKIYFDQPAGLLNLYVDNIFVLQWARPAHVYGQCVENFDAGLGPISAFSNFGGAKLDVDSYCARKVVT
jgi:hypothetical protein